MGNKSIYKSDLLVGLGGDPMGYAGTGNQEIKACVAVIFLVDGPGSKVLMMKRSERDDDDWSGQIAFPGGRCEKGDARYLDTAIRETNEEMGFELLSSEFLGYLKPLNTNKSGLTVLPCIFWIERHVAIKPNKEEVSSYKWVPTSVFLAGSEDQSMKVSAHGIQIEAPAIAYEGYVIWGLTYRILKSILSLFS
jgi:8-oxo-dGTP pyrophosphatase MutT (NUDIX family)